MKVLELKGKEHKDFVYGVHGEMTLDQYAEMPFNETYEKTEGTGRSFALYSKTHKINDNVIANTALVLDIDKSPEPIFDQLKAELERLGLDAVIGTTHSNDPDNNLHCLRAVIPFKTPVPKDSFKDVVKNFVQSSPFIADLESKELLDQRIYVPSQYWLDPSVHPDREVTARKERTTGGAPLIPDTRKREYTKSDSSIGADVAQNMPSEAILRGSEQYLEGSRDNGLTHEVGLLINKGLRKGEVLGQLIEINEMKCIPPLPLDDVKRIADSIWKSHYKDKPLPTPPKDNPFGFRTYKELMQMPPIEWLVSQHLTSKGVMFIYGSSQAGKTFASVDLALSLCFKKQWLGFDIKKNVPVRYCAFEDYRGVSMRVDGWAKHHGYTQEDLSEKFQLGGEGAMLNITSEASVNQLINALKEEGFKDGVIFIDTFNKVCGGEEENANGKMGMAIIQAERISQATNSLVILIHHNGKNKEKGMRGGSALHAGADLVYRVDRFADHHALKFEKIKNAKDGHNIGYKLETVELDQQHYDDENANTAVVIPTYTSVKKDSYVVQISGENNKQVYALIEKRLDKYNDYEDDYDTVVKDVTAQWVEGTDKPRARELVVRSISALRDKENYRGMVLGTGNRDGRANRIWLIKNDKYHIKY
jgi:hypothetical protein